ncbi:hypothetical protein EVAR_49847_1 [Eumeta japonica]|uniref:Uncharacterized protein n=1 Tax=Eumeta variegata TaxID=151549 RepID=A0A4C1YW57_EUMVA|nr:hypothetical protein EVAR_49847_1 [Eumeta japonica]
MNLGKVDRCQIVLTVNNGDAAWRLSSPAHEAGSKSRCARNGLCVPETGRRRRAFRRRSRRRPQTPWTRPVLLPVSETEIEMRVIIAFERVYVVQLRVLAFYT